MGHQPPFCAIMSSAPGYDNGATEVHTAVNVLMQPGDNGGYVDIHPNDIPAMLACNPEKTGTCAAALSLDHLEISGANVPVDSHVVLTTPCGKPLGLAAASHIDSDGSMVPVSANIRPGNYPHGLGIKIPLNADVANRHAAVHKDVTRMKNWKKHLGMSKEEIIKAHKRMMQKVHPDRGGSDFLAAQINQAKDTLLS